MYNFWTRVALLCGTYTASYFTASQTTPFDVFVFLCISTTSTYLRFCWTVCSGYVGPFGGVIGVFFNRCLFLILKQGLIEKQVGCCYLRAISKSRARTNLLRASQDIADLNQRQRWLLMLTLFGTLRGFGDYSYSIRKTSANSTAQREKISVRLLKFFYSSVRNNFVYTGWYSFQEHDWSHKAMRFNWGSR